MYSIYFMLVICASYSTAYNEELIQQLQRDVDSIQQENILTREHMADIEALLQEYKEENDQLRLKIKEQESKMASKLYAINDKISSHDDNRSVFFSAVTTQSLTYNSGHRIIFDNVYSNNSTTGVEPYNPDRGTFTCPYNGYYMFHVTIGKGGGNGYYFQTSYLTTNKGHRLAGIYNYQQTSLTNLLYWGGSINIIVRCEEDEEIYVGAGVSGMRVHGTDGMSQFSGYMVKAE